MGVQKKTRKFATVKRIIGQRDARLKKNIVKNEERNKQKKKSGKGDDLVRDVYVPSNESKNPHIQFGANHSLSLQPTSTFKHVLPTQHRPSTTIPNPDRYQLSLSHSPPQIATPSHSHGYALCNLHSHHHQLRDG
jgi:hypothetical protein